MQSVATESRRPACGVFVAILTVTGCLEAPLLSAGRFPLIEHT